MTKLKREELLEWLDKCWGIVRLSWDDLELADQAYEQIKKIIEKPQVTEEWFEEKASELYNLLYYETFNQGQVKDFIRSLVKET